MKRKEDPASEVSREKIAQLVSIEPLLIQEEFATIAGVLARYNELYSRALHRSLRAERAKKKIAAQAYIAARAENPKATEAALKAAVEVDDDYDAACEDAINAEVEKSKMYGIVDAVRTKKEALVSLGAHIRAELGGDPSLRKKHRTADGHDDD